MHRFLLVFSALVAMVFAAESAVQAQIKLPKLPKIPTPKIPGLPKKPEDLVPKFPQNETQFSGQTKIHFQYTIWNDSNETVRFRLPSGKTYLLYAGQKGSYTFTGQKPHATMHVFNTGKTYQLNGGDHKFHWMKAERRVGFDLDYRQ